MIRQRIGLGMRLVSPAGTKWTVIKVWTRGHGGEPWYKIESDGGRIRDMMMYEFERWSVEEK